jgi:hypothetical protein
LSEQSAFWMSRGFELSVTPDNDEYYQSKSTSRVQRLTLLALATDFDLCPACVTKMISGLIDSKQISIK